MDQALWLNLPTMITSHSNSSQDCFSLNTIYKVAHPLSTSLNVSKIVNDVFSEAAISTRIPQFSHFAEILFIFSLAFLFHLLSTPDLTHIFFIFLTNFFHLLTITMLITRQPCISSTSKNEIEKNLMSPLISKTWKNSVFPLFHWNLKCFMFFTIHWGSNYDKTPAYIYPHFSFVCLFKLDSSDI